MTAVIGPAIGDDSPGISVPIPHRLILLRCSEVEKLDIRLWWRRIAKCPAGLNAFSIHTCTANLLTNGAVMRTLFHKVIYQKSVTDRERHPETGGVGHMSLSDKTALVTGGARGIGAATATALSREGAGVVIIDIEQADGVVDGILSNGGRAWWYQVDISDHRAVEDMVRTAEGTAGPIGILVNNAGIISRGTVLDMSFVGSSGQDLDKVRFAAWRLDFHHVSAI